MDLHQTCSCLCTALLESVHHSECLKKDGACEHGALHQRAATAAQLDEAAGVCVLIHVGVAQASTALLQDKALKHRARPVRPTPPRLRAAHR